MKQLTLNIPKTCSEKWDSFVPTSTEGRFCSSCSKEVIDFTRMSDSQILDFFSNPSGKTCGRFRPDQMKIYSSNQIVNLHPGFTLLKAGLLSLMMMLISKPSSANVLPEKPKSEIIHHQNQIVAGVTLSELGYTVRGIVKSADDGLPIPGVNVILKGSTQGTVTDDEGRFEIKMLKAGDALVFSFIGLVTQEYEVPNKETEVIEIQMKLYWDITGEVSVDGIYTEHSSGIRGLWQKVKALF